MIRCENRCPGPPLPAGLPVDMAANHPRYKYYLEPGAQCVLEVDHDGPHRDGGLIWHSPPLLLVGGKPYRPPEDPVVSDRSD